MNQADIALRLAMNFDIADDFGLEPAELLGPAHEVLYTGQTRKRDRVIQDRNHVNSGFGAFSSDGDSLLSEDQHLRNVRFIQYSSTAIAEPVDNVSCTPNGTNEKTIVFWLTDLPRHPFAGL